MKIIIKVFALLISLIVLSGCGQNTENNLEAVYMNITAEEAKEIMDT